MGDEKKSEDSDGQVDVGIATPMRIGAAIVAGLRLATLIFASYILVTNDAETLVQPAFRGDPGAFRFLMIAGAWLGAVASVAHLLALRGGNRRRIVITALTTIASVLFFAAIRGWGLNSLLQPLEVASLFSSLFILRMVVGERPD